MATLLIDYTFDSIFFANSDGTLEGKFKHGQEVPGPGRTALGSYSKAVDLKNNAHDSITINSVSTNNRRFCVQAVFRMTSRVLARENIAECTKLPFSLYVVPGRGATRFDLRANVGTSNHGWNGCTTQFKKTLSLNRWYTVTMVYDLDTVALYVNNGIVSVHAFPQGALPDKSAGKLFLGTWTDGHRNQFKGQLAAFKLYSGIPEDLERLLDERRDFPEWHITYKYELVRKRLRTGNLTKKMVKDNATGSYMHYYQNVGIMYHPRVGMAFEMHGSIYARFKSMRNRSDLGYLVSDEVDATRRGARKSIFSRGGIYWSRSTGAHAVLADIYLTYEDLGESRVWGLPTSSESSISGGKQQVFQRCRIYFRNGSAAAHEVHGAILNRYLRLGGPARWGFPVSNEMDVKKNGRVIGKCSEFENCTIYWSGRSGAFETHGSIRKKYEECGGPAGELGFPTSNEIDIPRHSGVGKMNTFQKGSILWYGTSDSIIVARPFKIFIGRISSRESEGALMGQNDIHFYAKVKENGRTRYDKRKPRSGDFRESNVVRYNKHIPVTFMPNEANKRIVFSMDIRDSDPGDDDHLGNYSKELNASNGWGLHHRNGTYNESFRKIRSFTWSVKPQVNIASLSYTQRWWGIDNNKTSKISWQQFARAYRDVDSDTEWWDVTDWLQTAFYELVVKGVASGGNCFGMSLEGIYAAKTRSIFSLPLDRFNKWNTVKEEFNIKHCYQVGAGPIWWFLGQFVTGNTHDPKDVFRRTRRAYQRGKNPVVCISQNYDFSGGPHCVMPVAWHSRSKPWTMTILDPNFPGQTKTLTVDPDKNSFKYVGSRTYKGKEWSGGRFHYMPFSVLNGPPRTPVWDAILLLLTGTILILADDAETESITDFSGNDLDAFGKRAKDFLKEGRKPEEFFVGYRGFQADNIRPGQILLRNETKFLQNSNLSSANMANHPVDEVLRAGNMGHFRNLMSNRRRDRNLIANRNVFNILNDDSVSGELSSDTLGALESLAQTTNSQNFIHNVKGRKRNGSLEYIMKHTLSELKLESNISANEVNSLKVKDLGTLKNLVTVNSPKAKQAKVNVVNKLGVKGDFIKMTLNKLPIDTSKGLELNIKQGIGGIEIGRVRERVNVPIKIETQIDGRRTMKNFTVGLEDALRIKPASLTGTPELNISRMDRIFGPTLSTDNF